MLKTTIGRITLIGLGLLCGGTAASRAQQLSAVTMPLKDDGTDVWQFYGDKLVGVDVDRGVLKMGGRINAYSIAEGKFLWRHEVDLGYKMNETGPVVLWDVFDQEPVRTFGSETDMNASCAFSPDGRRLAIAARDGGGVRVVDIQSGAQLTKLPG